MKKYNEKKPWMKLSDPRSLERNVVNTRSSSVPANPNGLDFVLDHTAFSPDFFRADIRVDDARHLLFATNAGFRLLCHARRWYVVGTFKLVRRPFVQLWTIHAY